MQEPSLHRQATFGTCEQVHSQVSGLDEAIIGIQRRWPKAHPIAAEMWLKHGKNFNLIGAEGRKNHDLEELVVEIWSFTYDNSSVIGFVKLRLVGTFKFD